jgi:8-oxo-dGTP pyrophosphatase MutT (NUDIX family)
VSFLVQFAQKALIIKNQSVLLIQKGPEDIHNPLRWETPGGRLQAGESLDEQLRREVFEEVGLKVEVGAPLAIWSWQLGSKPGDTVVGVLRMCTLREGDPNASNQDPTDFIRRWTWVPLEGVREYDLMPSAREATLEAIQVAMQMQPPTD